MLDASKSARVHQNDREIGLAVARSRATGSKSTVKNKGKATNAMQVEKGAKKPKSTTAKKTCFLSSKGLTFLDLCMDIRAQIYSILEAIPDHSSDDATDFPKGYDGWSKTRKSLLFVCRQVHNEFAPYFLRSTTIRLEYWRRTPELFSEFLATLDPIKVINIRHLEYRVFPPRIAADMFADVPIGLFGVLLPSFRVLPFDHEAENYSLSRLYGRFTGVLHLETFDVIRSPFVYNPIRAILPVDDFRNAHSVPRATMDLSTGWLWWSLEQYLSEHVMQDSYVVRTQGLERFDRSYNNNNTARLFFRKSRGQLQKEVQEAEKRLVEAGMPM
ncbi:uncharacterized protein A1O5_03543 [Cladophialophora psammophila CBS 110553]|uniref:Uncharacterized protein n=1 Tax=Cladophialophora psammophila CBS 110553 TaxID=1182543 RepID=W9XA25_9EURO|nr:uncharacterized protein A1O5_03543 [Cladophialophora psammophila CBS 110553]EXJ73781.1 hypothetical protein A1O5_03543 [Cladophialophora psammophila CBS 110553]